MVYSGLDPRTTNDQLLDYDPKERINAGLAPSGFDKWRRD